VTRLSRAPLARQIARRSKSNLAFALATLPRQRKRDMITFYAFCRVIDDIADDDDRSEPERRASLEVWRHGVLHGFTEPDELQQAVAELPERYPIRRELLAEIVQGVMGDLDHAAYETFEDLLAYCYKVASVVGLVSIEIFGYQNHACRDYAINLGYALQLTNIIRDVREDAERGRIYLPREDLRRFHVSEAQLIAQHFDEKVEALLRFEYGRARHYYEEAARLLPREDRRRMLAAEMMAGIYSAILDKIRRKNFRVFDRRVRLSKFRKLAILGAYTARGLLPAT
jgi:phytoene synthase